jgi:hypothetical protein
MKDEGVLRFEISDLRSEIANQDIRTKNQELESQKPKA